jgi:peroxiredoxin
MSALLGFGLMASMAQPATEYKPGDKAPDFEAVDTNNQKIKLSDYRGKIVILEWHNHLCPFVKKHYGTNNMQSLQEKYTSQGVIWLTIVSSAPGKEGHVNKEEANKLRQTSNMKSTATILDESGTIGHMFDARTTPHLFVINKDGNFAYMGAIDDKPSTNPEDIKIAKNHLSAAVDALINGQKVELTQTVPYGCSVKYAS